MTVTTNHDLFDLVVEKEEREGQATPCI